MYAIIKSGGKQYRVAEGQTLLLEKLPIEVGQSVDFNEVLMIVSDNNQQIGTPFLSGVTVTGDVLEHGRRKKIEILKFKRRKHHMKHQGHRQSYTAVKITQITGAGGTENNSEASHGT